MRHDGRPPIVTNVESCRVVERERDVNSDFVHSDFVGVLIAIALSRGGRFGEPVLFAFLRHLLPIVDRLPTQQGLELLTVD